MSRRPWLLSKHQGERPRVLLSERPAVAQLCREYLTSLEAAGIHDETRPPYGWSALPRGRAGHDTDAASLLGAPSPRPSRAGGPEPPVPFDADAPDAFARMAEFAGGRRPEARVAVPLLPLPRPGRSARALSRYLRVRCGAVHRVGLGRTVHQLEPIPMELLPARDDASPAGFGWRDLTREGLNVAGYFRAELGIGEAARQLISAIESAGIPHSTTTSAATLNRQEHPFAGARRPTVAPYDINVLCVNADSTPRFARDVGPDFFAGRHTAGYWFWEVEQFPEAMRPAFDVVDEVWTATDFIADAVRSGQCSGRSSGFRCPCRCRSTRPRITRARLGLPERFIFLFVFDFPECRRAQESARPHRGVHRARSRPRKGRCSSSRASTATSGSQSSNGLRAAVRSRSDMRIVDGYYTEEEKNALLAGCDCYVSLHRVEGLGLTMAEAMALGKPVVATGYSGNLHFMTPENSFLVDYVRVSVPAGCDPYPTTAVWAEPDVMQAAEYLRAVVEQPLEAGRRARKGQQDVIERHNLRTSAHAISKRVEAIRRDRRSRVIGLPGASVTATTGPLAVPPAPVSVDELEAMLVPLAETSALRVSAEGRSFGSLRMFAQRALFRALRPLWFQQHQFHAQVVAALRLTIGAIRTEQRARETVDARVRELTRKLLTARQETHRLQQLVAGMKPISPGTAAGTGRPAVNDVPAPAIPLTDEKSG